MNSLIAQVMNDRTPESSLASKTSLLLETGTPVQVQTSCIDRAWRGRKGIFRGILELKGYAVIQLFPGLCPCDDPDFVLVYPDSLAACELTAEEERLVMNRLDIRSAV